MFNFSSWLFPSDSVQFQDWIVRITRLLQWWWVWWFNNPHHILCHSLFHHITFQCDSLYSLSQWYIAGTSTNNGLFHNIRFLCMVWSLWYSKTMNRSFEWNSDDISDDQYTADCSLALLWLSLWVCPTLSLFTTVQMMLFQAPELSRPLIGKWGQFHCHCGAGRDAVYLYLLCRSGIPQNGK